MSVYNANLLTRIHDPVFDRQNFKTEFRLDAVDSVYLSNMRLINMGIQTSGNNVFNGATGAFCIDSIQLYDGNVLLDQILQATIWKTFKNLNNTNDENMSVESELSRTTLGYMATGSATFNSANGKYEPDGVVAQVIPDRTTSSSTAETAWLSLKELMPFLGSSLYLPTRVFKNLRLVINWVNPEQLKNLVVNRTQTLNTYAETALVVDEMVSPELNDVVAKEYKGVAWRPIENDRIYVPPITGLATNETRVQDNKFLVNGFNNKTLNRLTCVQTPTDSTTWTNPAQTATKFGGNQISVSQWENQFQFRVNGSNKLPRDGYTKKNQRLAQLTEAWGEFNLVPTANFTYVPNMKPLVADGSLTQESLGRVDYTAVEINERVNELQLLYKRTGVEGADNEILNQALYLNLFGEVNKVLEVNGDSYTIKYL